MTVRAYLRDDRSSTRVIKVPCVKGSDNKEEEFQKLCLEVYQEGVMDGPDWYPPSRILRLEKRE